MSVLSRSQILKRLRLPVSDAQSLVVSPIFDSAQLDHDSIDVRLGTHFLAFKQTQISVLDLLSDTLDSELLDYQRRIHVRFGGDLIVHPNTLILGCTLEYLRVPKDLSCQVLTRSTWGRLGLIIATAVWVHPLFAGCLTLEILNHGTIPLRLHPGIRIAQLVFQTVGPSEQMAVPLQQPKYACLTRPWHADLASEIKDINRADTAGRAWHGQPRQAQDGT
ncbi:MAG: dCTP deaminase [bacterium]|nr:dCTP deaminase [bacterium]